MGQIGGQPELQIWVQFAKVCVSLANWWIYGVYTGPQGPAIGSCVISHIVAITLASIVLMLRECKHDKTFSQPFLSSVCPLLYISMIKQIGLNNLHALTVNVMISIIQAIYHSLCTLLNHYFCILVQDHWKIQIMLVATFFIEFWGLYEYPCHCHREDSLGY